MNKFFLKTLIPAAALFVLLPGCVRAVRAEGGGLSLPTAGLSYALSQPDTRASVKDVEDYLTASGMIRTRKGDAVKGTDEKKQDKSAQQTKSGSAAVVPEVTEIVDTALTKKQQREADATVSQTAILIEETAAAAGREIDDSYSKEVVAVAKAVEDAPEGATTEEAVSIAKEEVVLAQRAEDAGVTVEEMRRADEEAAKAAERAKAEEELGAKRAEAEAAVAEEELCVALVSDFINIRSEPSTDSEIVGKLYANGVAKVLSEPDDFGWMKISSGEVVGYIKAEYVATGQYAHELAAEVEEYRATVNTETLRVRVAPDLDSDVITLIGMGEELNILEELAGWLKVDTPDGEGYFFGLRRRRCLLPGGQVQGTGRGRDRRSAPRGGREDQGTEGPGGGRPQEERSGSSQDGGRARTSPGGSPESTGGRGCREGELRPGGGSSGSCRRGCRRIRKGSGSRQLRVPVHRQSVRMGRIESDKRNRLLGLHNVRLCTLRREPAALRRFPEKLRYRGCKPG